LKSFILVINNRHLMVQGVDLKQLADVHDDQPTFLSLYIDLRDRKEADRFVRKRVTEVRKALHDDKPLLEAFEANLQKALALIECAEGVPQTGHAAATVACEIKPGLVVFISGPKGFLYHREVSLPVPHMLIVGTSPYIRPLLLLRQEFQDYVILLLDHENAHIFQVSSCEVGRVEDLSVDLFKRHKKGGWSQMRFQRNFDLGVLHFLKEVAEHLKLHSQGVRYIIIAGPRTVNKQILPYLPKDVADKVLGFIDENMNVDLKRLLDDSFPVYSAGEHHVEGKALERLRSEVLKDGLAAYGIDPTMEAVVTGRASVLFVEKDTVVPGIKCERCGTAFREGPIFGRCPRCDVPMAKVDLVEEMAEAALTHGTDVITVEGTSILSGLGGVAAILRYK